MKYAKKGLISIASMFILLKIVPLVSAYSLSSYDISQGPRDLINLIINFLSPFFEVIVGDYSRSDFFFAKVLLLILLYVIIQFILKKNTFLGLDDKPFIIFIVAAIVSILGVRFLPENDLISGILIPYGTLAIAITTFLPLIIYFFFVESGVPGKFGRRAAWTLYGIIFLVMWYSRAPEMSSISNWIYTSAIALLVIFFIFDKEIHQYFALEDFRRAESIGNLHKRIRISKELDELKEALQKGHITQSEYDKETKRLKEAMKEFVTN